MARAIWTGSLSFGLVNLPVGLYPATEDRSIHFNQFQAGTSDRVRNKRVNERTGEEVPYNEIVKGYDLGNGEFVLVTPEDLTSIAPGRSRTIEVSDFVELADVSPSYYDKSYFLAPAGKNGERAYALLLEAMSSTNKAAVATFVLREKQYLVVVRPDREVLSLHTLFFADEVRDPKRELDSLPESVSLDDREIDIARLLIDSMTTEWQPEKYHDTYRERVEELIDQRRHGAVVAHAEPEAAPAPVIDLLEALQASVNALKQPKPEISSESGRVSRRSTSKPAGGEPASGAIGSLVQTKSELLRQAADLGIAGRSKMSRESLEEAIEAATKARRRAS